MSIDDLSGIFLKEGASIITHANNTTMQSVYFFQYISWRLQNNKVEATFSKRL